jgi:murein DD-endopeptidase MepM/ murein hydrolase activator NlpD
MSKQFIKPCEGVLTSPFGWRTIFGARNWHQGIDLAKAGTISIRAAAAGQVVYSGVLSTYGNTVRIVHNLNGVTWETNYAHLKLNSQTVKVGDSVAQGQIIGIMGSTGQVTGQHLHFEIHKGRYAPGQPNAVDPWPLIEQTDYVASVKPSKPTTTTKPKPKPKVYLSIVDYLKDHDKPSGIAARKVLAKQLKIPNYTGTEKQNELMLKMLQK